MSLPDYSDTPVTRDLAKARQVLDNDVRNRLLGSPGQPFLVALSGLPGTGKTYFARALARRLPFLIIGSDRMRKVLVSRPEYSPEEHTRVFTVCHRLMAEYLEQGYRVIFDATNLTENFRRPIYDIAQRLDVPLRIVGFDAPQRTVRQRLAGRASGKLPNGYSDADWQIYCRLQPGQEPIQRRHFQVNSPRDVLPVIDAIVRRAGPTEAPLKQPRRRNRG